MENTIAGYTIPELAQEWLKGFQTNLTDTLEYHKGDEGFQSDLAEGVPAEILNTAEQMAWETLRSEFGAFGFGSEEEESISETIIEWREDGTLTKVIEKAQGN